MVKVAGAEIDDGVIKRLRHECAGSGLHHHDGCSCSDEELLRRGRYEPFEGQWLIPVDTSRRGWWRFHEHYDRNGYCDNPGRGY